LIRLLLCFINTDWPTYTGEVELRPAVKKLYQLRPKVTASSVSVASQGEKGIISVASRVVSPKRDGLLTAISKELHQLHGKLWVYKMFNNWKVLTVLLQR